MRSRKQEAPPSAPRYPGIPTAVDGSAAVVEMETAASEAAGAYPITPSTQMGEGWAAALAAGKTNVNGRRLLFFEPEGEHAAAAVTAGMSMVGLRATNFSSGQGIAYMHESLYAAVGKRLTYVLNIAARAMTKHALNVHAGHDDYHAVDDTGFFQLFAKNVQEGADLNLIAHRIAELSLNPGICAQDGFLTSHVIESCRLPERELVREFLGDPADIIESPTPAQRLVFGERRRRIPEMFDLDSPTMLGVVQNQDAYQQGVAAQRPFYFDHVAALADRAFDEYAALTGRRYARAAGHRMEDAEYAIVGQGSVVWNAEAVADHLRAARQLRVGVVNVTMFRPFPADRLAALLRGKRAVVVLERVDQPLAVDAPLLREIRAAMGKAVENGRARGGRLPHAGLPACAPEEVPDFYSGCFGLGSRDLQPTDLIAAVDNMLEGGKKRRQFYLGIEFIRPKTRLPKLQIWQEKLLEGYPDIAGLALTPAADVNLASEGSLSLRIHSVGGWGAITMGKNLALTAAELLGLHIKANPKYGSEKKGQPTTFYATLAREPVRLNCELRQVDVVLSPDPNVTRHSDPLAGLAEGGVLVIQSDRGGAELWASFPTQTQRALKERKIRVYFLDAFRIAGAEASGAELRYRMQGAAFMGAFFRVAPLLRGQGVDEAKLFAEIGSQLKKKFGRLGAQVVDENLRVIRRGYDEVVELDVAAHEVSTAGLGHVPERPARLDGDGSQATLGNPGRFWEQVGYLYSTGQDGIADPFAATSALPAASSTIRDMTAVRMEVPEFVPANCTGCGQCWTQCPDTAIPGVVNQIDEVFGAAIGFAAGGGSVDRVRQIVKHLGNESRRIMREAPFTTFGAVATAAYATVADKLGWEPERRAALDAEWAPVQAALAEFPLAKTAPFFDAPESRAKGSGGLLSITVNPGTCKGCNICVAVCPDDALRTVKQDAGVLERLRRNWQLWQHLPETDDRYVSIASLEEGIGTLPSLLLKKANYLSMLGGDGACMGCGEKTILHLVFSALNALMQPRVKAHVERLDGLIARLDDKARRILASEADLARVAGTAGPIDVPLAPAKKQEVERIAAAIRDLRDLRWRYTEGPSGAGRAPCGIANATGCSSVWGSTYPYNPYPVPWVNHLFQDAPSVAIGIFEGHMRKMADGFAAVRRAELELAGEYDPARHEAELGKLDWRSFSDEEFGLCPPIFAVGGDGALLDIGFQNLSRLLASGKPVRVVMLDTQVYSNTGGQACTSGFLGQVSDMAEFGPGQRGKEETRKELALIAMAHRNVFVLQSSQASPSHLLAGVLRGLQSRYPAVFSLHCPCPPEHGVGDEQAPHAAKLALESRSVPLLVYDPAAGPRLADRLNLDGNPSLEDPWPTYELKYVDAAGAEQVMELPVTVADWACTETRFRKHFSRIPADGEQELVPFHDYLALGKDDRAGKTPFIHTLEGDRKLGRLAVSDEIVRLTEDRQEVWALLREMAGLNASQTGAAEADFEQRLAALRTEYEAKLADLKARYPWVIARRLAEDLLGAGNGGTPIGELLAKVDALPAMARPRATAPPQAAPASLVGAPAVASPAVAAAPAAVEAGEALTMEPYIDSALCTACNECTNLNKRLFAYNAKKQAYIKDPRAGTFKEIVQAAEKCPVKIIHPGTPLNPAEKDLAKWLKRAQPFN
ncbi:MAG: 2-oxoacid:acceptor oxidoreductase family protein [Candidatus Rokubacteria bacterium]|nr:2-oxoacid:acceptor oxidoreductase family protein [Candidatus Rokubacteria bacterium]